MVGIKVSGTAFDVACRKSSSGLGSALSVQWDTCKREQMSVFYLISMRDKGAYQLSPYGQVEP